MRVRIACLAMGLLLSGTAGLAAQTTASNDSQVLAENAVADRPVLVPNSCQAPAYPVMLRAARVEGRVLLQFVVDTLGRVDATSIRAIQSTHSHFEEAARRAVATCRYRPARFNSHAVRVLVQTPFTFNLGRS